MSTDLPPEEHPFFFARYGVRLTYATDAEARIARIKHMTEENLEKVLALDGVQKTVRAAAERRLRLLRKTRAVIDGPGPGVTREGRA